MNKSAQLDSDVYCPICYTNVITDGLGKNKPEAVKLSCEHLFCKECVIEQFKSLISEAKLDKLTCLDFECRMPVEEVTILSLLGDEPDVLEKYKRFKEAKELESDPLIRYCPKAGCAEHMKASSLETEKLQCPTC